MNILGISCFYHDSAAVLVKDGYVVSACQEERFTRNKYDARFPLYAINSCLQDNGLSIYDIDYIIFHEKPFLKFSRTVIEHLLSYPFSYNNFRKTMPYWFKERLIIPLIIEKELGYKGKVLFAKHHFSHAASAFLVSPYEKAAILTVDGVGEWATASYGVGFQNEMKIIKELYYPHSLGLVYSAFTGFLGFMPLSGEGKVMGLAGYGKPEYMDKFRKIISVNDDGSIDVDESYFGFNKGNLMFSKKLVKLFGKPREPGSELTTRDCNIAATLQKFTEDVLIKMANHVYKETEMKYLCVAGGVFLNCLANHKILENTPFEEIFIQPASSDAGCALGAAMYLYNTVLKNERIYTMEAAYLGPYFSDREIEYAILNSGFNYKKLEDSELYKKTAKLIAEDKIIGWFQDRMEWGPRALGNRSILANPCNPRIKDILNEKVKKRESFRPYAPAVLEEKALEYFDLKQRSPFMLLAAKVKNDKRHLIPGVTHVDGTARIQTVSKNENPKFWNLIKEFENIIGIPVVLNTSFNLYNEPIVCTPEDAILCFKNSKMDYLVMNNYLIWK